MTTFATITITHIKCGNCGVHFGLDQAFIDARKADQQTFYCPNGHSRWYPPGGTEADKLRRELASRAEDVRIARIQAERAREQAEHERRSAAAYRGHLTRMRKRIANGVCPCCTRSFTNVRMHMATQHPDVLAKLDESDPK